jgi:hypothetical protein
VKSRALLVLLLLPLMLSACWMGTHFYGDADLKAPIRPGLYRWIERSGDPGKGPFRVTVRGDGYTVITPLDGSAIDVAGFAPIPARAGLYVAWFERKDGDAVDENGIPYGLLDTRGREARLLVPICKVTRAVAERQGGTFLPDRKMPICYFSRRGDLEAALAALARRRDAVWSRLQPVPERPR